MRVGHIQIVALATSVSHTVAHPSQYVRYTVTYHGVYDKF